MTSWTRLLWDQLLYIGKHGSEGCTTSTNPMKIQCMDRHIKVKQDSHSPRNMVHKKSKKNFLLDLFNINARELASFAQVLNYQYICQHSLYKNISSIKGLQKVCFYSRLVETQADILMSKWTLKLCTRRCRSSPLPNIWKSYLS